MPRLTPATQKIRAESIVKGLKSVNGNQTLLAKKQGRTPQAVSQQLKQPYVQKTMAELLDKSGVTDPFLSKKIKEGSEATKLVYVESGDALDKNGNPTKVEETVDDFQTRHKYIETALKLKGHLSQESNKDPIQILQVFQGMDPETLGAVSVVTRIERIEAVLKNQLSKRP